MLNGSSQRPLRLVFVANLISMIGSGMNYAALMWYILQTTRSEAALGTLVVLQTLPTMVLMPLAGVVIDREDRRYFVMGLDAGRAVVIAIAISLVFTDSMELWHLYAMGVLVGVGSWMFWPAVTALIQELAPDGQVVSANAFLLAAVQGGFLLAGAVVGFLYDRIGLGGILIVDLFTYVASFTCYALVRRGRHRPAPPVASSPDLANLTAPARFFRELADGLAFIRARPSLMLLGAGMALFWGAVLTQTILTGPLTDRQFHAGATGFGWLNAGWGLGAFASSFVVAGLIRPLGARIAAAGALLGLTASMLTLPHIPALWLAVPLYAVMGSARGVGGVALTSLLMDAVPRAFIGRVQNTIFFCATGLQVALASTIGVVAERLGVGAAFGLISLVASASCVFLLVLGRVRVPAEG